MLWKKHRLRVLECRFLRKIFRPKMEVVTGGWLSCYGRNIG